MKDQYFGDVNDYLKYGLLRCFSDEGWRIGVCWMLTRDDGRSDGGKIGYLSEGGLWRTHDPVLFDALNSTVGAGVPRSTTIAEKGSLIPGASFFSEIVPDNQASRDAWLTRALSTMSSCDLLFFDPDNGMEVPSKGRGARDSSKYLYWGDARVAWERGASVIIFQHFARENRAGHIERLVRDLSKVTHGARIAPLRTSNVLFLLACQPGHQRRAEKGLQLVRSRWAGRIDCVPLRG